MELRITSSNERAIVCFCFFPISFQSIAIFYEILSTDLELRGSEIKLPPELISEMFNVAELGRSGRQ